MTAGYVEPPVTADDDRVLLSIAETVRVSGLGRSTVYELMAAGRLGSVKIGTRRLVPRQSIVELAQQQNAQRLQPRRALVEVADAAASSGP